jgi:hypothetical protein
MSSVTPVSGQLDPSAKLEASKNAVTNPDIPHIYLNEFASFSGLSDFVTVLGVNDRFVAVLHMSAPVAKSLGAQLLSLVTRFEQQTQQSVLSLDEANSRMHAPKPKADSPK